jgi:hypothetical protein
MDRNAKGVAVVAVVGVSAVVAAEGVVVVRVGAAERRPDERHPERRSPRGR